MITVTIKLRDFDPDIGPASLVGGITFGLVVPASDGVTLTTTEMVPVLLHDGVGTVQLRPLTVYKVNVGAAGIVRPFFIRTPAGDTPLAQLWATGQVDPATFSPLPVPQTVADQIASLASTITAVKQEVDGGYPIPDLNLVFENGLV